MTHPDFVQRERERETVVSIDKSIPFKSVIFRRKRRERERKTPKYALGNTSTSTAKDIAYEWVSQKWVDIDTNATHNTFGNSVSDTANTSRETSANPQTVYVMETYWNLLYAVFTNPYYEAPAYRTGTSQGFAFTSGTWKGYGYTAIIDDEANSSSGKLVNGVRQWEWDMPDIGGGRLYSGANNWIYFVPGTAEDNGTWYHGTTSTGGTAGTRNGRVINIGTSATFDETNAFVDGLVPYGDIP